MDSHNPTAPDIVVQVVHIEGPRKGEIDELRKDVITIGRDPGSDVAIPADVRVVSRHHAEIKREGNRFLLINQGRNGCFVNGRQVDQAYLKQGDVIVLAEGGPKISFLYTMKAPSRPRGAVAPTYTPPSAPVSSGVPGFQTPAVSRAAPEVGPFTLQYGIQIRSLKQASVKIGREDGNDFVIKHPSVFKTHAEIVFQQQQYAIRDLTGSLLTFVNERPVKGDVPLTESDIITFGDGGPQMRYLGTGRFVEVIEQDAATEEEATELQDSVETHSAFDFGSDKPEKTNFFKSLFKR